VVLRIHALIEAVILHPGVFAGLLERERAVGATIEQLKVFVR
jgi:hypothetical protein